MIKPSLIILIGFIMIKPLLLYADYSMDGCIGYSNTSTKSQIKLDKLNLTG